jgi:hypothetical protein
MHYIRSHVSYSRMHCTAYQHAELLNLFSGVLVLLTCFNSLCVTCTRKRRDGQPQPRTSVSSSRRNSPPIPKMSREDARRALSDVTEVVPLERREGEKFACMATMNEKASAESTSIFEKEWYVQNSYTRLHRPQGSRVSEEVD